MNKFVELVLNAMTNHDPDSLPMTDRYELLENCKPAALCMTEAFRVFRGVKHMGLVFEDKVQHSIFFYADMDEGGNDTLVYNRIVTEGEKIRLLEFNIIRSRGDAGFMYLPEYCESDLTEDNGWVKPIPEGQRASREELEKLAAELYTPKADVSKYVIAKDCLMMENGGLVRENPDYAATMWGSADLPDAGNGLVFIPGDIMPIVSQQEIKAWVIDEEQGVIPFAMTAFPDMNPAALHRISSFAYIVLDSLPFAAGIIVAQNMAGLTQKQAYKPLFFTTVVWAFVGFCVVVLLFTLFPNLP